jgi:MscS family membrane protein
MTADRRPALRPRVALAALLLAALGLTLLPGAPVRAQLPGLPGNPPAQAPAPVPAPAPQAPQAPRATPRSALLGYLEASREGDFQRAAGYLALGQIARDEGARVARQLKFVLDQQLWLDPDVVSPLPGGDRTDGSEIRDRLGDIETPTQTVPIWLERRDGQWRFSAATVAKVGSLYSELGLGRFGENLPDGLFLRVGELELWQLLGVFALLALAYLLAALLVPLLLRLVRRVFVTARSPLADALLRAGRGPFTAIVAVWLFELGSLPLRLSLTAKSLLSGVGHGLAICALAWFGVRGVEVLTRSMERALAQRTDTTVLTIIPVVRRLAKIFLLFIAGLAGAQQLGFNVFGVIAGLGVIGIGVALAAQKTFENFFGTLSILIDQPIRRGNTCRFGSQVGTVEDIGLRSTRIRTADRTLITVPNGEFAGMQIENFAARDQIRFSTVLGLRRDTSADQLRAVLTSIRELLGAHARVVHDSARVRFIGIGASSLDIELFAYIQTAEDGEFQEVREELLLQVISAVETSGAAFAIPSQTLYIERDAGLAAGLLGVGPLAPAEARPARREPAEAPAEEPRAALEKARPYPGPGASPALAGGSRS